MWNANASPHKMRMMSPYPTEKSRPNARPKSEKFKAVSKNGVSVELIFPESIMNSPASATNAPKYEFLDVFFLVKILAITGTKTV